MIACPGLSGATKKIIPLQTNRLKKKLFLLGKKLSPDNFKYYSTYIQNDTILLKYWDHVNNWGDTVNPYLVNKITGKKILSSNRIFNYLKRPELLGIGSIISGDLSNYVIWGSGVLSQQTTIFNKPVKVLALRGYNSLKKIRELGCDCDVFGDPVLLFPSFFDGSHVQKKYRYGIIPHFKDKSRHGVKMIQAMNDPDVKIIDIQSGAEEFVREVLSCENIISSSLHGLILAEAYGIPTCRVVFSEELHRGDFKFYDYYSGVGIKTMDSVLIHDNLAAIKHSFLKCSIKDLKFNSSLLAEVLTAYINERDR